MIPFKGNMFGSSATGGVTVSWLGQAGFAFRLASGALIAVDPYLSDCCERYFGFKRLMPRPMLPGEAEFDLVIASHAHYDHFDVDSMPWLLAGGRTRLACAADCLEECERLHILQDGVIVLEKGGEYDACGVKILAVDCDHGELAPHAVGLLLHIGGRRVYVMGDTAYRPDLLEQDALRRPDLLILPINGAFGNLNEDQAARVAARLQPGLVVPCHFWMFAEHGGNPGLFAEAMKRHAPGVPYLLPSIERSFCT